MDRNIYKIIIDTLENCSLRDNYKNEDNHLQPHLKELIDNTFEKNGMENCEVKISRGRGNIPFINLLSSSFWPDIEVCHNGKPIIAIEVKLAKSLPGNLTDALGKCMIYKLKYKYVIGFLDARTAPKESWRYEYDDAFWKMVADLAKNNIYIIIKNNVPYHN